MRIAFIGRSRRFSPNRVGQDRDILVKVRQQLLPTCHVCHEVVSEDSLAEWQEADVYITMARSRKALTRLADAERSGFQVINTSVSVMQCLHRVFLMQVLENTGIPVPPLQGDAGYWVKRGDGCAETADDVQYAPHREAADALAQAMCLHGIGETEIRAHVQGDLVKFYGVRGVGFFHCYYPGLDGGWKYSHEVVNGHPHQYTYNRSVLQQMTERAAETVGLEVYGGDVIIRPDGSPVLIDLNDWPSFSRCQQEAAEAIAVSILQKTKG